MIRSLLAAPLALLLATTPAAPEIDWDSSPVAFLLSQQPALERPARLQGASQSTLAVVQALADRTATRLGRRWVGQALRIARVESRFRCDAQGPLLAEGDRAQGIGQVRVGSARLLGYTGTVSGMRDCATGIDLMLSHMERCIAEGATTDADMARCHVAGWNSLGRRLKRRAERYAAKYRVMVARAEIPPVADNSGWLVRGSTAAPWWRG